MARGIAQYHMGLSQPSALPSGPFAQIRLRALVPISETSVEFTQSLEPGEPCTAVLCRGADVLGDPDVATDGSRGLPLRVSP